MSRPVFYSAAESETRHRLPLFCFLDVYDVGDQQMLAELAADDFHSHHDGWEYSWPVRIELYGDEDGAAVARFDVERESVPEFTARRSAA